MQTFQSPNYFNQYQPQTYQPYQPAYMPTQAYPDRLAQLQQMQQSLQQPQQVQSVPNYLNGKVVDSMDAVKATDIPMDGSMYYFPKADGTDGGESGRLSCQYETGV